MTEFERKLMQLTPEESRELSAAMNTGYNKRLADKKAETEIDGKYESVDGIATLHE